MGAMGCGGRRWVLMLMGLLRGKKGKTAGVMKFCSHFFLRGVESKNVAVW